MFTIAALPLSLRDKISSLARRIRLLRASRGASLLLLVLLLIGGAALLADYWFSLPAALRFAFLAVWAGAGAFVAFFGLLLPLCRRLTPEALAALIEEKHPDLGERLTSVVEVAGDQVNYHGSPALVALLIEETEARTHRLNFLEAVPARYTIRLVSMAAVLLLLAGFAASLWPRYSIELGRRFLMPWRTPGAIVFYSLDVAPGDTVTARGRPLTLSVALVPDHDRVTLPTASTLLVTDAEGNQSRLPMLAERPDAFSLQLDKVAGDFRYQVEAGDAVSDTYQVTAVEPVDLVADSPTITISPPVYAKNSFDEQTIHGLADLTALQHSRIRFDFHFTRPAQTATLEWLSQNAKKDKEQNPRATIHPLVLTADRRAASCDLPARASGNYRLLLEAEHGIRTEPEPRILTVKIDLPPAFLKVSINDKLRINPSPQADARRTEDRAKQVPDKEDSKFVLAYDSVPLDIALADDVGVERAKLEYRINDGTSQLEPIPLQGAGSREATSQSLFKLADKSLHEGDTVHYRIKAADNRRVPEAGLGPNIIFYPPDQRWLTLKIARTAQPLRQQEIFAQREDIDRRLEAIKNDLLKEQRDLNTLRPEARKQPVLKAEQARELKQLREDNWTAEDALRELARDAAAIPPLQALADQAREIAEQEMDRSGKALQGAEKETRSERRDRRLHDSDTEIASALRRIEEMRRANERLAQARLDQAKLETLSEREQRLAERTAEQAARDLVKEPANPQQVQALQREQKELSNEFQRLAEQSESVRKALDAARAEQAQQLAARARELAQAERDLMEAAAETRRREKEARMAELARKQQELAERASQLAKETRQAAQVASTQPLKPENAHKAAQALRQDNAGEALRLQQHNTRELERLAKELDRARDQARDPREAARQLARLQEALRQNLHEEMAKKPASSPPTERLRAMQREEEALRRATEDLPVPAQDQAAQKEQREATERAAQAMDALQNEDARHAEARMAQAAQALQRLAEQMPAGNQTQPQAQNQPTAARPATARGQAPEPATPPQGLPNREQAQQARDLVQQQRELRETVQRLMSQAAHANLIAGEKPVSDLTRQQAEVARQSAEMASDIRQEQGPQAPATQRAQQATQSAQRASDQLQAGAVQRALQAGTQTAQQLWQLAKQLSQTPPGSSSPKGRETVPQARQLAERQEDLNRRMQSLAADAGAQQAQQQARQQELQQQTGNLNQGLTRLARQMHHSAMAQESAQRAAQAGRLAQAAMQQAQDNSRQGNQGQAQQAQQQAAQTLEYAARQAELAARQAAAALGLPQGPETGQQPGQALQQAQAEMNQAQAQLSQGQNQAAQGAMQRASQALQQAAQQLGQQPGQPNSSRQPSGLGVVEGGRPDPSLFGSDAKKYAGKRWGELPGELRTKIIQDMQAKYGDDYARIIKLYFEQIADTKKHTVDR